MLRVAPSYFSLQLLSRWKDEVFDARCFPVSYWYTMLIMIFTMCLNLSSYNTLLESVNMHHTSPCCRVVFNTATFTGDSTSFTVHPPSHLASSLPAVGTCSQTASPTLKVIIERFLPLCFLCDMALHQVPHLCQPDCQGMFITVWIVTLPIIFRQ